MVELRRLAQPLRPVLLPARDGLAAVSERRMLRRGRSSPIPPIRQREVDAAVERFPYHQGRWVYISVARSLAGDLIARHRLRTALELGPAYRPIVVGADV